MTEMEELEQTFGGATPTKTGAGEAKGGSETDQRIAELERQLAQERVESGRLKKANEEAAALREEIARLKAAQRTGEDNLAQLPDSVKGGIPDDIQRFTGAAIDNAVKSAMENERRRYEEEMRKMRETSSQNARRAFAQQIKSAYPTFFEETRPGGKLNAVWVEYLRRNEGSVQQALQSQDFETLQYHIERFQSEKNVSLPSGGQGASTAAPEPRSLGGGAFQQGDGTKKTYTPQEYDAALAKAHEYRSNYDFENYRKLKAELDDAIAEGRVKQQ